MSSEDIYFLIDARWSFVVQDGELFISETCHALATKAKTPRKYTVYA